ncbi:protease modulator HflC [Salinibius halmophilus]|uniref:protease modulator HflC n=1 Tax=Salinibius halmophilus TaxID=1853216 RepID=UPI000E6689A3|nr:protease modulator HflC [Salinibius halmophilus]
MNKSIFALVLIAAVVFIGANSLYIVSEKERAVQLRFREVIKADVQPGLHVKVPFIDTIRRVDGRVLTMDTQPGRYPTAEQKFLVVDYFTKWRIVNPQVYFQATNGDERSATLRLSQRIDQSLRNEIGVRPLLEVVSGKPLNDDGVTVSELAPGDLDIRDQIMASITRIVNENVGDDLGVEVLDVRVKAVDLPEEVELNVFERMRSDRELVARDLRSRGQEQAEIIRANADRQRSELIAEGRREAEIIRGNADAEAAGIYAESFGKDPEFFEFTRSLRAYSESFNSGNDVLVLDPNDSFFKYLRDPNGN